MSTAATARSRFTAEEVRASASPDPAFQAALDRLDTPDPKRNMVEVLLKEKASLAAEFPAMRAALARTRPRGVSETEHFLPLSTGFTSRVIIVSRKTVDADAAKAPVVVLLHGGGFVMGFPEFDLELARIATMATGAVFVLPTYRLTPDHLFPSSINDTWAVVQLVAKELSASPESRSKLLPPNADAAAGFIIGGTSAGANMASVIAHLAHDAKLQPPLTGQFFTCGSFMLPRSYAPIPSRYADAWLSYEQNKDDPLLPASMVDAIMELLHMPADGSLMGSFAWPNYELGVDSEGRVGKGHVGLPPAYFQAAGMDVIRDDTLVYETVLREESGVKTRLDLYPGFSHCAWSILPDLEVKKKWEADSVEGLRWLLEQGSK